MTKDCTELNLNDFQKADGFFHLEELGLTSLKGLPSIIPNSLVLAYNHLDSLEFIPKIINGWLNLDGNNITNLDILPEEIEGTIFLENNPIKGSLLNVFNVKGLTKVYGDNPAWNIINGYLPKKEGFDITEVQKELKEAVFFEEAGDTFLNYGLNIGDKVLPIKTLLDERGFIKNEYISTLFKTKIECSKYIQLLDIDAIIKDEEILDEFLLVLKDLNLLHKDVIDEISDTLINKHIDLVSTLTNFNPVENIALAKKLKENKEKWFGVDKMHSIILEKMPNLFTQEDLNMLLPIYKDRVINLKTFAPSKYCFDFFEKMFKMEEAISQALSSRKDEFEINWLKESNNKNQSTKPKKLVL